MNLFFTFSMHDDQHFSPQHAEGHPTRLAVAHAIVLKGDSRASEDLLSVRKIQTALLAGDLTFAFVSSEAHS